MPEITSNMVRDAANRTGFSLEFKAKNILEQKNYNTKYNEVLIFDNESQETDIIAWETKFQDMILECKGAKEGIVLILIKEPESKKLHPSKICNLDISDTGSKLVNTYYQFEKNTWLTFTGDFYQLKNTQEGKILTTATKNNVDTNFYKAQLQILKAIVLNANLNAKYESQFPKDITPIILTNSEIWVVDYENTTEKKYKWVLHRAILSESSAKFTCNGEPRSWYTLPIVDVQYFDDFLKSLKENTQTTMQNKNSMIKEACINSK